MGELLVEGHALVDCGEAVPVVEIRGEYQVPGLSQAVSEGKDAVGQPCGVVEEDDSGHGGLSWVVFLAMVAHTVPTTSQRACAP